jgi:hypothetical protein
LPTGASLGIRTGSWPLPSRGYSHQPIMAYGLGFLSVAFSGCQAPALVCCQVDWNKAEERRRCREQTLSCGFPGSQNQRNRLAAGRIFALPAQIIRGERSKANPGDTRPQSTGPGTRGGGLESADLSGGMKHHYSYGRYGSFKNKGIALGCNLHVQVD